MSLATKLERLQGWYELVSVKQEFLSNCGTGDYTSIYSFGTGGEESSWTKRYTSFYSRGRTYEKINFIPPALMCQGTNLELHQRELRDKSATRTIFKTLLLPTSDISDVGIFAENADVRAIDDNQSDLDDTDDDPDCILPSDNEELLDSEGDVAQISLPSISTVFVTDGAQAFAAPVQRYRPGVFPLVKHRLDYSVTSVKLVPRSTGAPPPLPSPLLPTNVRLFYNIPY
ncbi:hypothetical protein J6590_034723 [Homalodisca vitripennis]|nr:hypothetical protein J6590_034723 [Homalodisca vitripennis]